MLRAILKHLGMRRPAAIGMRRGVAGIFGTAIIVAQVCGLCLAVPSKADDRSPDDYKLGADDVIRVQVWGKPELGGSYTVDPNGDVVLPLIGRVTASGQTAGELGAVLKDRYSILFPAITEVLVSVEGYYSRKVVVLGEVRSPGPLVFVQIPSIWDVLIRAGGTTPAADLHRVEVSRKEARAGEEQTVTVDLSKGSEKTPKETLPTLRPGDTIIVPSRKEAGEPQDEIQLMGAVRQPGFYSADVAVRVSSALVAAGGPLDNANLSHVRLLRRTEDGVVTYDIDFDEYLKAGSPDIDVNLLGGDIVSVPSKGGISPLRLVPLITGLTSIAGLVLALTR